MIEIFIPMSIPSCYNISEHWTKSVKRKRTQRQRISWEWIISKPKIDLPCEITLIRCSPRELDYDNLTGSLKHCKDVIADKIIPGLAPGRADGDKRIKWIYDQEKSKPQGLRIKINGLKLH